MYREVTNTIIFPTNRYTIKNFIMASVTQIVQLESRSSPFQTIHLRRNSVNKLEAPSIDNLKRVLITESEITVCPQSEPEPIRSRNSKRRAVQTALTVASKNTYKLDHRHPVPDFENEFEVQIRTCAVGLNPIDWKSLEYNFCIPEFPWVTGREMAGVVERVAPGVTSLKPGDRVWTSKCPSTTPSLYKKQRKMLMFCSGTYYRDRRAGCFQDLVTVPEHTVSPIPGDLSFEEAACLGVAALTAGMTLWNWLEVPMPSQSSTSGVLQKEVGGSSTPQADLMLVWGGSTVTGQFAIQIAVQCGLEVIAVTSEETSSLAFDLGATYVVTRTGKTDQEIVAEIRSLGGNRITRGIDLVGSKTAALALSVLSTDLPCWFAPLAFMSSAQAVPKNITIQTVEMKRFVLDRTSEVFSSEINRLVESGLVKLPKIQVLHGGLTVVEEGLQRLKKGDMQGRKMVVSWRERG